MFMFLLVVSFIVLFRQGTTTNCKCRDYYGSCRKLEEEWVENGTWKYVCSDSNLTKFLGCTASNRGNNRFIPVGSSVKVKDFWFKCESTKEKLRYEEELFCKVGNRELHLGETYREGVFERICQPWGIGITGCFYTDEKQQEHLLEIGKTANVGVVTHHCDMFAKRPGRVQYFTTVSHALTPGRNHYLPSSFPAFFSNLLQFSPQPWLHEHASDFILMNGTNQAKIRYLT